MQQNANNSTNAKRAHPKFRMESPMPQSARMEKSFCQIFKFYFSIRKTGCGTQ
jgi:hypothetical protein